MISTKGKGKNDSWLMTADQAAFIASNPEAFEENKKVLEDLAKNAEKERKALVKAHGGVKALEAAQKAEADIAAAVKEAEAEAKQIINDAQTKAHAALSEAEARVKEVDDANLRLDEAKVKALDGATKALHEAENIKQIAEKDKAKAEADKKNAKELSSMMVTRCKAIQSMLEAHVKELS